MLKEGIEKQNVLYNHLEISEPHIKTNKNKTNLSLLMLP
jgi:hypothetical protein